MLLDRISKLADQVDTYAKEKLESVGAVPQTEVGSSFLQMPKDEDADRAAARREILRAVVDDDDQAYFEDAMEASEAAFSAAIAEVRRLEGLRRSEEVKIQRRLEKRETEFAAERQQLRGDADDRLRAAEEDEKRRRNLETAMSGLAHELANVKAENEALKKIKSTDTGALRGRASEAESALEVVKSDARAAVLEAGHAASREADAEITALRQRLEKRHKDALSESAALIQERDAALQRARSLKLDNDRLQLQVHEKPRQEESKSADHDDDATLLASKLVQKQALLEDTIAQRDALSTKLHDARRQINALRDSESPQQVKRRQNNLPLYHKMHNKGKYSSSWSLTKMDLLFQRYLRSLRDGPTAVRFLVVGYAVLLQLYVLTLLFVRTPCDDDSRYGPPGVHTVG